jgi:flagellar motor switch protein FliN
MSSLQSPLGGALVDVKIILGKTTMALEDILNADAGSLVELDRVAGQAVDILVNDTPFGKGELAVVGNHMAVRVTELFDA